MSPSGSRRFAERSAALLGALMLLCGLCRPCPAAADEDGAYSAPKGGRQFVAVPIDLFVNGLPEGAIEADLTGDVPSLDGVRLREVLGRTVPEELLEGIPGSVALAALVDHGIPCEFDPGLLQLRMTVPPERQKPRMVSFGAGSLSLPGKSEEPAGLSAYLNLRAHLDVLTRSSERDPEVPLELTCGPVINLGGTVLEASLTANLSDPGVELDYARVVRDFPEASLRLAAGSLFLPVTGFMSPLSLAGVELIRDPQMTRFLAPESRIGEELLVAKASRLSISLNNQILWSARMEPGRYRVLDLPFVTGVNDLVFSLREDGAW